MNGIVSPVPNGFPLSEPYIQRPAFSNGDIIPIDPALSEPQLDPALLGNGIVVSAETAHPPVRPQSTPVTQSRQYSQGPQGDPFAPPPPPSHLPVEEPLPPPAKALKKKRPPRREEECGFCHGDDTQNKQRMAELMVSCSNCGRSAHPSCLELAEIGDIMRSYPWTCSNCKRCEVCHEEVGDNRMIFCDYCDRGWHLDCLQPPLAETPPGKWYCPLCPQIPPPDSHHASAHPGIQHPMQFPHEIHGSVDGQQAYPTKLLPPHPHMYYREASVASSSRLASGLAQQAAPITEESDGDGGGETTPRATRYRSKKKYNSKGRSSGRETSVDTDATRSESARPAKRMRIRLSSPKPVIRLRLPARDKGKAREEDPGEPPKGMFDDILSPEDRDTSATSIVNADKQRFEKSRVAAEEKLVPRHPPLEIPETAGAGPLTRPLRALAHRQEPVAAPERSESPSRSTPVPHAQQPPNHLRIQRIRFGKYDIETWFDAPFPEEYASIPDGRLWICEFCLKYMKSEFVARRHQLKCKMRHPPGDEIYRDGVISIFEVDGRKNKIYCQNLCLLSKMFLDHKSLFYDVEPFLFYVITEFDDSGARFVGYFSKEKRSPKDYNVSCIMTLPVRQRQGWGQLLIDFSYLLSKKEQRAGSPEKPLSPLGALGYKSYWTFALMRCFRIAPPNPRLEDISVATSMTIEDIYNTLTQLKMIRVDDDANRPKPMPGQAIKVQKGRKSGVARKHLQRTQTHDDDKVKGPFVPPAKYEICWDPAEVDGYMARWEAKGYLTLRPEKLKWSPFIMTRTRKSEQLTSETPEHDQQQQHSRADAQSTPGTDALATPGPGAPLEAQDARSTAVQSVAPAFSLFDDDNVISASSPREPSRILPEAVFVRSPSPIPGWETGPTLHAQVATAAPDSAGGAPAQGYKAEDAEQLEQDRALAQRLAQEESSWRLRSRRQSESTGPLPREEPPPTVRKARPFAGRRMPRRSTTIAPSNSTTHGGGGGSNSADRVTDDAALAAKLAREESPRRHLRSRSNTEQEVQRAEATVSPRKRRRVDSLPDANRVPSSPTSPASSRRNGLRADGNRNASGAVGKSTGTKGQRKSSRFPRPNGNGNAVANNIAPPWSSETLDATDDPPPKPSPTLGTANGVLASVTEAEDPGTGEDTRYDDMGTPATTSRRSAQSEVTLYVAEDQAGAINKAPPVDVAVEGQARAAGDVTSPPGVDLDGGGSGDEDAEGEDEDANADADAEGKPELDML